MSATTALVSRSPTELALAGPIGSFDAYVDAVSRIPVLSREEEQALATRLHTADDLEAARHDGALAPAVSSCTSRVAMPGMACPWATSCRKATSAS